MNKCRFCNWNGGAHDPNGCPTTITDKAEKAKAEQAYRRGWTDGRYGMEMTDISSHYYTMGHANGEAALEEAENGDDPRFH